MTASMNRILAAVYPPDSSPALVLLAKAIVGKMEGNPCGYAVQYAYSSSQAGVRVVRLSDGRS